MASSGCSRIGSATAAAVENTGGTTHTGYWQRFGVLEAALNDCTHVQRSGRLAALREMEF